MAGILIIAHAPLAHVLRACAEHIYGNELERVIAIDVEPNAQHSTIIAQAVLALTTLNKQNSALILTDIYGGTPSNIATQVAQQHNVPLIAGINLPMLLRAITYRKQPIHDLIKLTIVGGIQGVIQITPNS
ncbi:MAG: PTS fructose transporter subunit IIA [Ottowia sp.]|nr:PTS fructose transporter subunit IIA [Ottowia sp.]